MSISKTFLTAGRAVFTLEIPASFAAEHKTAAHYTYRVGFKKGSNGFADAWFVSLLTGPNNEEDYTYLGMLNADTGEFRTTGKSAFKLSDMPCALFARAVRRVFDGTTDVIEAAGFKLHHDGKCGKCARLLTVPASIESGIGPECAKKMFGCRSV